MKGLPDLPQFCQVLSALHLMTELLIQGKLQLLSLPDVLYLSPSQVAYLLSSHFN